jgi:glutamine synthetase adenylyltransferase
VQYLETGITGGGALLLLLDVLVLLHIAVHQLGNLHRVDLPVLAVTDLKHNQLINQASCQSINQAINDSTSYQPINQAINHSIKPSTNQKSYQANKKQSIYQSV